VAAIEHDIVIRTYSTFTLAIACYDRDPDTLQLVARDLTGWTGAMQVRLTADTDAVLAEADVDIDAGTGVVTAVIDDDVTADYTWRSGVYDLVITDGVDTESLAAGVARCVRGVTR
jgi:hypothetical protein